MAHVRSNVEHASDLPEFGIEPDEAGWLVIKCPRDECGHTFFVERRWFVDRRYKTKNGEVLHGRPCPYCFKVGAVPALKRGRKR